MKVSFEAMGEVIATFCTEAENKVKPGDVVCMSGYDTVGLGSAGKIPCGIAATVAEDGCVGVQISGLALAAYSGTTAPAAGWNNLSADGKGGFQADSENGQPFLVISAEAGEAGGTMVVKL